MRIPKSPGKARRIEHRVAGADANPYLTLAAILSGIHYGITNEIDPGSPNKGNAGENADPAIPFDLIKAQKQTRNSEVMRSYLGDKYIDVYTRCKMNEYEEFRESGNAETKWYF